MKIKKILWGIMLLFSLSFIATTPVLAVEDSSSYTYEEVPEVASGSAADASLTETVRDISIDFLKNNALNILAITSCLVALGIILSKNKKLKKERKR